MSGVDKDGLFGDERKKLGEVQDVLEQFAPASAYHGDRNLREMGEAMLAQFTGLAKTLPLRRRAETCLLSTAALAHRPAPGHRPHNPLRHNALR